MELFICLIAILCKHLVMVLEIFVWNHTGILDKRTNITLWTFHSRIYENSSSFFFALFAEHGENCLLPIHSTIVIDFFFLVFCSFLFHESIYINCSMSNAIQLIDIWMFPIDQIHFAIGFRNILFHFILLFFNTHYQSHESFYTNCHSEA